MIQFLYLIDQPGQNDGLSFSDSDGCRQLLKIDNGVGNGLASAPGSWKFHIHFIFDSCDGGYNQKRNDAVFGDLGCQTQLSPENSPFYGASKRNRIGFKVFIDPFYVPKGELKTNGEYGGLAVQNSQMGIGQYGHLTLSPQKIHNRTETGRIRKSNSAAAIN